MIERHWWWLTLLAYLLLLLLEWTIIHAQVLWWVDMVRLMNALAIWLQWVSQHLFSLESIVTKISLMTLGAVYVHRILLVCLVIAGLSWLLRSSSAWSGWTVVWVVESKSVLGHVVQIMLSFQLYLLELLLYLDLVLLTRRKIVTLLLRIVAIGCVGVAWYRLIHVAREVLVGIWVFTTEESSLCQTFGGWIYDACLLFWWWTLWLGKMHDVLFNTLISNRSWLAWVIYIIWIFVLHLIG